MASVDDKNFYPICFLADVFNCLTCAWFDWDTNSGRCRNHGALQCKLTESNQRPDSTALGGTMYQ